MIRCVNCGAGVLWAYGRWVHAGGEGYTYCEFVKEGNKYKCDSKAEYVAVPLSFKMYINAL